MAEKKITPNLNFPKNSGKNIVDDLTSAYIEGQIEMPEILSQVANSLMVLEDFTAIIALYLKRKGESESLFTPDDIKILDRLEMNTGEDSEEEDDSEQHVTN